MHLIQFKYTQLSSKVIGFLVSSIDIIGMQSFTMFPLIDDVVDGAAVSMHHSNINKRQPSRIMAAATDIETTY